MARGRKRQSTPSELSIAELQTLLKEKIAEEAKRLPQLKKRQSDLQSELDSVDAEIRAIEMISPSDAKPAPKKRGPKPGAKRRGRPAGKSAKSASKKTPKRRAGKGGKMTLPMAIHKVLEEAGKPMKAAEIKDAIQKQGLLSNYSKSFPQQVAISLSKGKEFKKVERGVYSL
jgi:hypothetical protein